MFMQNNQHRKIEKPTKWRIPSPKFEDNMRHIYFCCLIRQPGFCYLPGFSARSGAVFNIGYYISATRLTITRSARLSSTKLPTVSSKGLAARNPFTAKFNMFDGTVAKGFGTLITLVPSSEVLKVNSHVSRIIFGSPPFIL